LQDSKRRHPVGLVGLGGPSTTPTKRCAVMRNIVSLLKNWRTVSIRLPQGHHWTQL